MAEKSRAFGLVSWSFEFKFESGICRFCALLSGGVRRGTRKLSR